MVLSAAILAYRRTSIQRERCLPYEDLFNIQSSNAPRVVRRVLLLLKDYAQTRVGIQTHEDLTNALDAIHDLVQWLGDDFLATIPGGDRFAVQQIKAVLDRRAGSRCNRPARALSEGLHRCFEEYCIAGQREYRQMSPDEQHLIDQIRSQPQAKQRERADLDRGGCKSTTGGEEGLIASFAGLKPTPQRSAKVCVIVLAEKTDDFLNVRAFWKSMV